MYLTVPFANGVEYRVSGTPDSVLVLLLDRKR